VSSVIDLEEEDPNNIFLPFRSRGQMATKADLNRETSAFAWNEILERLVTEKEEANAKRDEKATSGERDHMF
jgi:hypothetical protein